MSPTLLDVLRRIRRSKAAALPSGLPRRGPFLALAPRQRLAMPHRLDQGGMIEIAVCAADPGQASAAMELERSLLELLVVLDEEGDDGLT